MLTTRQVCLQRCVRAVSHHHERVAIANETLGGEGGGVSLAQE